jgi:ABC-type uncharacterized transport system ATPase subunit
MLEVEGIHTFYGLSHILFGVSLKVEPGEIACLLGRNCSGQQHVGKMTVNVYVILRSAATKNPVLGKHRPLFCTERVMVNNILEK